MSVPTTVNGLRSTPIAIIGQAALFPMARTLREYWNNIVQGHDCITEVPTSHWRAEDYYDPSPDAPDKSYSRRGGFIPGIEFDPLEFGIPPNILEVTDTAQLLALVVAKRALEDAGYGSGGRPCKRESAGVVLGVAGTTMKLITPLVSRLQHPVWEEVLRRSGLPEERIGQITEAIKLGYVRWEEDSFPGMLANVVAGRIANRLDLGGLNCTVDAACASSMGAIRMAIGELVERRCDMMISGGIDTDNSIATYLCFSKTPAFSRRGRSSPFDADADGMLVGEGLGVVVLKRLEDAERDGDRIYAVIRGFGSSSDGRSTSIYAPRAEGQIRALRRAYGDAGVAPSSVGLIEAHGTGTVAGDLTEVTALRAVFGADGGNEERRRHIALGSVKSQIGHTKAAAGAAGLIKTALALYHKVLPPTLNVARPNPKLELERSPFYLNTLARPWIRPEDAGERRRAGVSAFGFGGTNHHAVLEEYEAEHTRPYRLHAAPETILLHATSPEHLLARGQEVLAQLTGAGGARLYRRLAEDACAAASLPAADARLGFVASSPAEAAELLSVAFELLHKDLRAESWHHPRGVHYRRAGVDTRGRVVALFPGQGSQYLEMGRELAINYPPVRQAFAAMDRLFAAGGQTPVSERVFPPPLIRSTEESAELLQRTEHAQPAIGALSMGLYKLLRQAGFCPDMVAGHSFGELSALWAAGTLGDEDYLSLVKARGQAMAAPDDPAFDAGAMLAVSGDLGKLEGDLRSLPDVTIANFNSRSQVALAGSRAAIAEARRALEARGYSVVPLPVSAAFHTPLVGHAQRPFAQAVDAVTFRPPQVPVYANTTARPYPAEPDAVRRLLAEHMLRPVLFYQQIEEIYAEGGSIFVEVGPKGVLSKLVAQILHDRPHVAISFNASSRKDSDRQLRDAAVQLRVLGLPLRDIDPYRAGREDGGPDRAGRMTVRLDGSPYVSPETRAAFEQALHNLERTAPAAPPQQEGHHMEHPIERGLELLSSQQQQMLRAHERYLEGQMEYARIFSQLTQQQQALLATGSTLPPETALAVLQSTERNMMRFHDQQEGTLRAHERYLQTLSEYARLSAQLAGCPPEVAATPEPPAQVRRPVPVPMPHAPPPPPRNQPIVPVPHVPPPAPPAARAAPEARPAAPTGALGPALLEVVSVKTGYPVEMLGLSMDLEADLGIDSIKRVEILSAMQERFLGLPGVKPADLAELRTLGQITDYLGGRAAPAASTAQASAPPPAAAAPGHDIQRSPVALVRLPPPDELELSLPPRHCCLITDDGGATSAELARSLSARGWPVVLLRFPESVVTRSASPLEGVPAFTLADMGEEHLTRQLAALAERHGPAACFIHVHPPAGGPDTLLSATDEAVVKHVFLIAKHLQPQLAAAARQGRAGFLTVARLDGAFGLGARGEFGAAAGGLFGLTKSLGQEWGTVFCRALDIDPALAPEEATRRIVAELHDPDRKVVEVAHGGQGRTTLARA